MALLDLLGRRWAIRVIWELRDDTLSFRELRTRCDDMSPSVLNDRLGDLRDAGIVEHRPGGGDGGGYRLTKEGKALLLDLKPLTRWAKRWFRRIR